jgi:hypothetical protein
MDLSSIVEHYKKTRKDILKIKNWEIFISVIIESLNIVKPIVDPEPIIKKDSPIAFVEEPIEPNQKINYNQK